MSRIAVVALALVTAACAHAPVRPQGRPTAATVPAFSFADDTFAFANMVRAHHPQRSEEHTSELQSRLHLVCRLLLEKKKKITNDTIITHVKLTHPTQC